MEEVKKLITLVVVLIALAVPSAALSSGAPRLLDGGDGGGCHIGDSGYWSGHVWYCANLNGVGIWVWQT